MAASLIPIILIPTIHISMIHTIHMVMAVIMAAGLMAVIMATIFTEDYITDFTVLITVTILLIMVKVISLMEEEKGRALIRQNGQAAMLLPRLQHPEELQMPPEDQVPQKPPGLLQVRL